MLCPKCNKSIEDNSIECPLCGIVTAKYKLSEPYKPRIELNDPATDKRPLNIPYVKIGLAIIAVIILWILFKPKHVEEFTAISSESNEITTISCDTKEICVITYLAPWCPACKRALGTVRTLREKWTDSETIDFIVVVGLDKEENLNKMADKIGGEVYFDPRGDAFRKLGGRGVPHWYVLNYDNKLLKNFAGYWTPIEEHIKRLGL